MSDRSWLPTRKGTDLFPNVIQAPAKLVIKGVEPSTPLYYEVVSRFSGPLKQFHAKAQQTHALSGNPITRVRQFLSDDARATYTDIHGQELLELEVSKSVRTAAVSGDFWDFALIELVVPPPFNADGGEQVLALAHITAPLEQQLQPGMTWPVAGLATNFRTKSTADRLINAAESDDSVRTVVNTSGADRVFSVTVDLRPARGLSVATVDLHAVAEVVQEVFPSASIKTPTGDEISIESDPSLTPADYNQSYDDHPLNPPVSSSLDTVTGFPLPVTYTTTSAGIILGSPDYPGAQFSVLMDDGGVIHYVHMPIIEFDVSALQWVFTASGSPFFNEFMGPTLADTVIDPGTGDTVQRIRDIDHWRHWYVSTGSSTFQPPYAGASPVPAEVQVTMFKGVPALSVSDYDGLFFRWDFTDILALRPGAATIGRPGIPVGGVDLFVEDPGQFYGLPKLGTVSLPLAFGEGPVWSV